MKELCIACRKDNAEMLNDLDKYMKTSHCKIVTSFSDNNFDYLLFADNADYTGKNRLKSAFLDYFINEFKYNYIMRKIGIEGNFFYKCCVKVLALFDRETDEKFLLNNVSFTGKMYLDSFAEFRLPSLMKRWDEIADLARDNRFYALDFEDLSTLIGFLVSTMPQQASVVQINFGQNSYVVKYGTNMREYKSRLDLVTAILRLCPATLELRGEVDADVQTFLNMCFVGREKSL